MEIIISDSKINDCGEMIDLPQGLDGKHVLFVGAREGQVKRALTKHCVACGYWDLKNAGYIDDYNHIVKSKFKEFDIVVFAHPRRVFKRVRKTYQRLINKVRYL